MSRVIVDPAGKQVARATIASLLTEMPTDRMLECDFQTSTFIFGIRVSIRMQHGRAALQKIMGEVLDGAPASEAPSLAWPLVCGPGVAKRTRVLGFRGGVLRVEVPDVAWRNQLTSLLPKYLDALNQTITAQVKHILFLLPGENYGFLPQQAKSGVAGDSE